MSGLGAQATHGRAAARQQMSAAVRAALRFDVMVTSYSPLEALARDSLEDDVGKVPVGSSSSIQWIPHIITSNYDPADTIYCNNARI